MKKISFGRLLRNDRLMVILSLVLALWLWYTVISGSSNITTRTINCTLTVANVKNGNVQVIETDSIPVTVEVQGAWSTLNSLSADDLRVQLNTGDIRASSSCRVHVLASRNSQVTDYEIVSVSPDVVTLFCDEWVESRLFSVADGTVLASAGTITAQGDDRDIGEVSVLSEELPGGVLAVQGPQTVVSRIHHFVAQATETASIEDTGTFPAVLVAMDADGAEVDISQCGLMRYTADPTADPTAETADMTERELNVLVTVKERRQVTVSYAVANAPAGVDLSKIVSCTPQTVTLEGEKAQLEEYLSTLEQVTTIDFDQLSISERSRTIPVQLPDGITVVGTGATELTVTLRFDWTGYTTRTLVWNLGNTTDNSPIQFINVPENKTVTMLTTSLNVKVFGKREAVEALTAASLSATVDMSDSSLGTYTVRPQLPTDAAWVYYGTAGYTVYFSLS